MKNNSTLQKIVSTFTGIALSVIVLASGSFPGNRCVIFFGEPEYPSED